MDKPLWYRWARVYAVGFGIVMTGVLLFKYTTPTEEELINSLSPELRAQYEREKGLRRREQEELIKIVKQTSASNDPIWMTGPIKSPWDKDNKMVNLKEKYEKELAEKNQSDELERVQRELEIAQEKTRRETDEQLKKRTWFSWR
ncbi:CBP4 [Cyberlindnera jadinii]|uniref:Cytochrome b mRNA-processing protein 4 n=1 Tax=Cyberlindnera jadinii (strain ATCC 18201 / CBS 1600 / BCRC 20928 / JCM 3617 / NBRC 0987 / NRRL Y-1542) TaxID=983966 RepID=A0A0H5CEE1_CYBJN|nr:CBP4-domain-containing protein [Cyberlindnera jadinii NRRL Y-1542]ODV70990.1 CBP4-domain-containing protein [Cyberlindnera jadinii NRRL Y-1542]CEP22954.1 CBP4 [Cyberlindnera jadinii]